MSMMHSYYSRTTCRAFLIDFGLVRMPDLEKCLAENSRAAEYVLSRFFCDSGKDEYTQAEMDRMYAVLRDSDEDEREDTIEIMQRGGLTVPRMYLD